MNVSAGTTAEGWLCDAQEAISSFFVTTIP